MGRTLATSAVCDAMKTALDVAAVRTLCPGGVYRGMPLAQSLPYLSVGDRCVERPWNAAGTHYGSEVSVSVRVETNGTNADGHKRALTILSAALDRLEVRGDLTVTGWTVCDTWWIETTTDVVQHEDGTTGYVATNVFNVQVRQA